MEKTSIKIDNVLNGIRVLRKIDAELKNNIEILIKDINTKYVPVVNGSTLFAADFYKGYNTIEVSSDDISIINNIKNSLKIAKDSMTVSNEKSDILNKLSKLEKIIDKELNKSYVMYGKVIKESYTYTVAGTWKHGPLKNGKVSI